MAAKWATDVNVYMGKKIRLEGGTLWQKVCRAINSLFGHN